MTDIESTPEEKSRLQRDWTKGSVIRNLLHLSWPMVLMETLYVISQVVDMIWIGRLGSSAIAGVGIANMVLMLVMSMDIGIIMGVRAMVSRFVGADDLIAANHVAGQAFILGAAWGTLIMISGISLTGLIMGLFGVEAEVVALGTAYMRIMFAGWIALIILVMGLYVVQSSGDTISPLMIEVLIRILHVTLCPFLVLGLWIFPHMGVRGAALSNVISHCLGSILVLCLLFSGRTRLRLGTKDFRFSFHIILRTLKIGIPVLVMQLQRNFGNLLLTFLTAPFGTLAVAAHSLATRVEMFFLLPGFGFGMGAGVLVGQNLGARQPERAERNAWSAVGALEAFLVAVSLAILLWAEYVMIIFTTDPELVALGSVFLRIATGSYVIIALVIVLQSSITGAGDTLPNMAISVTMIWVIQLPLAFILSRYTVLGVYGLRWAIVVSTFSAAIAYVTYFRLGRWKMKKI